MPTRETGAKGYIGEAVVEQWLQSKYPDGRVVSQIRPYGISTQGGKHLDFGVIVDGSVEMICEVKSQDYIADGKFLKVNSALKYIWERSAEELSYEIQGDPRRYPGSAKAKAILILLVVANSSGRQDIGFENRANVMLFEDVWAALEDSFAEEKIVAAFRHDLGLVVDNLKNPKQGKKIREEFLSSN